MVKRSGFSFCLLKKTMTDFDAPIPPNEPFIQPELPIEGTNYLELVELIYDIQEEQSKGEAPQDFQFDLIVGEFEYHGNISEFDFSDLRDYMDEDVYPDDENSYWVLDGGLVSGSVDGGGLTVSISTSRTETFAGE